MLLTPLLFRSNRYVKVVILILFGLLNIKSFCIQFVPHRESNVFPKERTFFYTCHPFVFFAYEYNKLRQTQLISVLINKIRIKTTRFDLNCTIFRISLVLFFVARTYELAISVQTMAYPCFLLWISCSM
jgi:hypothetical protein